jgi:hypothetical protein
MGERKAKDTYLGARKSSLAHLTKVSGDVDQPYRSVPFAELLKEFKKAKTQPHEAVHI